MAERRRRGWVEFTILAAGVLAIGFAFGRYQTERRLRPFLSLGGEELRPLAERYGPATNTRYGEEWIIRDFFHDARDGIFVDIGANHYRTDSNTYYLETQLGWSGLAVEPQAKFAADYASHRPKTRFLAYLVSDVSDRDATLYIPHDDLLASADKAVAEKEGGPTEMTIVARTATLDDILGTSGVRTIDFLSIDVEGHEPQVLRGFSIDRFKPRLVCIEAHVQVRQQILDYFATHGYVVAAKYLRADSENLWFVPLRQA
jgi:FkbM family methyltransferase